MGDETVLSASGVDTKAGSNAYHTTFRLHGLGGSFLRYDDLYCCDGSGSANNDLLGNMRVTSIYPNAAGDSTQFTPSAGANYACVDDGGTCDDDSTYVESGTSGHKDLYNYTNTSIGNALGIVVCTDCRETDAESFSIKTVCKSGETESADAGQAIGSTNYVTKKRILETDPNTGLPWTSSGISNAQFGVEVV